MSQRPNFDGASIEELQRDIAATRARISSEVDALSFKLSPAGVEQDAQNTLGDAEALTLGAIERFSDRLVAKGDLWGERSATLIRRHSVTSTLLGFGFFWLVMRSSGREQNPEPRPNVS